MVIWMKKIRFCRPINPYIFTHVTYNTYIFGGLITLSILLSVRQSICNDWECKGPLAKVQLTWEIAHQNLHRMLRYSPLKILKSLKKAKKLSPITASVNQNFVVMQNSLRDFIHSFTCYSAARYIKPGNKEEEERANWSKASVSTVHVSEGCCLYYGLWIVNMIR